MLFWNILCPLLSSASFIKSLQLINAGLGMLKLKIFKMPGIVAKMYSHLPDMVQYWNSESVTFKVFNNLKISAWLKWLMVLVLESVSCLTPTEFKTLQPATSQLEKALNNSGINHEKSTAFLEDFCVFFGLGTFCLWFRTKKLWISCGGNQSPGTRTYSTGWQDGTLQTNWISHWKGWFSLFELVSLWVSNAWYSWWQGFPL